MNRGAIAADQSLGVMLMRLLRWLALLLVCGCTESGPVAIENNTPFPGIAQALDELPAGGALNIFVIHGMGTKQDESEPNLRGSIQQRLGLTQIETRQQTVLMARPDVRLDGRSIWPSQNTWACPSGVALQNCDAPYLDITTYAAPNQKQVVFYSLNYWGVLVWIKCSQLISADTHLTGDLTMFGQGNAAYCNARFASRDGFPLATTAASTSPLIVDHVIKNDILDWGFGDALLAISGYQPVAEVPV
jgi:hypothetical protein